MTSEIIFNQPYKFHSIKQNFINLLFTFSVVNEIVNYYLCVIQLLYRTSVHWEADEIPLLQKCKHFQILFIGSFIRLCKHMGG
jgi:hypothetical protein